MKQGEKYIITCNDYSDYGITDSFVALKTFSFDVELKAWLDKYGVEPVNANGQRWAYAPKVFSIENGPMKFLQSLRGRGLVADTPANEVHLESMRIPYDNPANDSADQQ